MQRWTPDIRNIPGEDDIRAYLPNSDGLPLGRLVVACVVIYHCSWFTFCYNLGWVSWLNSSLLIINCAPCVETSHVSSSIRGWGGISASWRLISVIRVRLIPLMRNGLLFTLLMLPNSPVAPRLTALPRSFDASFPTSTFKRPVKSTSS